MSLSKAEAEAAELEFREQLGEEFKDLTPDKRASAIQSIIDYENQFTPKGFRKSWQYKGAGRELLVQARIAHAREAHPEFFAVAQ